MRPQFDLRAMISLPEPGLKLYAICCFADPGVEFCRRSGMAGKSRGNTSGIDIQPRFRLRSVGTIAVVGDECAPVMMGHIPKGENANGYCL
jgi:hypothetical protein